jgi:glycosyltransferase involved in cell wall biosynthesis
MKILFLSQIVPYPPHGGVLQRGYNVIRQMSKYYDIHLLAFVHPDILTSTSLIEESRRELSRFCTDIEYFDLWPKKSIVHKYSAILLGLFTQYPFSVLAHRSTSFQKRIHDILATGEIDLVHFDTIGLARFYYDEMPCPAVLTHHNIESQLMGRRAWVEKNSLTRFYLHLQAKRLEQYEIQQGPKFSCNIMMSEHDEAILEKKAPGAVTSIIPNGVDTEYFIPRPGYETKALIYTGGMNMFANKDAVLYFLDEIWPLVKAKCHECVFYAVGQDPPQEILQIAGKDPSVVVTGYVDDVRPYVAKSAVYIVPLRVGGGTRLKVVDAMAQGKAIVSTSIGCEGISVTPGKNIIIADSPELFAQEIITLLKDRDKREKIGTAAREMVEKDYSWDVIGEKMEKLYNTLIRDEPTAFLAENSN